MNSHCRRHYTLFEHLEVVSTYLLKANWKITFAANHTVPLLGLLFGNSGGVLCAVGSGTAI